MRAWQMQPLSMALLASLTPPDVEVRFHDDRMEEIPYDEPTDLVAISVETFTALRAYKIARAVPRPRRAGRHRRLSCHADPRGGPARGRRPRGRRRGAGLARSSSTTPATADCSRSIDGRGRRPLTGLRPRRRDLRGQTVSEHHPGGVRPRLQFQVRLLLDHRVSRRQPEPSPGPRSGRRDGRDRQPAFLHRGRQHRQPAAKVPRAVPRADPAAKSAGSARPASTSPRTRSCWS